MRIDRYRLLLKYIALFIVLFGCIWFINTSKSESTSEPRDFSEIKEEGVLRVAIEYNDMSYAISGDSVSGLDYELIKEFARDQNLKLQVLPLMSFSERVKQIDHGKCDVIASPIVKTKGLKDSLLLTDPIVLSRQVLIQRTTVQETYKPVTTSLDLAKKTIFIIKDSPAVLRIRNLEEEIGDTIYVEELEKYGQEQLISLVANGDIDYAVCDENIAKNVIDSFPNVETKAIVGFTQLYSWGVSKQSPILLETLNKWIKESRHKKEVIDLFKKYNYKR